MPKFNNISNIPTKVFFEILKSKNYQLLKPKPKEQDLEQVFISIYDEFFLRSDNPEAKRYLELTKNVAFLIYKIDLIKQTLAFLYYQTTTKQMRLDYIKALKEGCDIEINIDVDFQSEVKRVLSENIKWLENDLVFEQTELNEILARGKGKEMNYIEKIVNLAVASPQNLIINKDMFLDEFIEIEKAVLKYQQSKQNKK